MYNGAGTFSPLPPPQYPAVAGEVIRAAYFNAVIDDILGGLTNAVTRDGQSPATGNLPMGGMKHTGAAYGVADDEYVTIGQLNSFDPAQGPARVKFDGTAAYPTNTVGSHLYEVVVTDYPWLANPTKTGAENSAAFSAAVAWLKSTGKAGRLVIPMVGTGVYEIKFAIPLESNIHYAGERGVVLKSSADSTDNILGDGYPLVPAQVAARLAGGTLDRLKKPDFLTNYTELEALVNGGFAGYAKTGILITDIIFDGNKSAVAEGSMNLVGPAVGTFLPGETVTSSSGGSSVVSAVFGTASISINPRDTTGTFNIGNTVIGSTSGAQMTIGSKKADDAYQNLVRFDAVSHSIVMNCEFRNSVFTALSIYDFSNNNLIAKNFFHDNNKPGTTYTAGWLNIYVEFDASYTTIRDNLIVGGLGYSVLVSCPGGVNRDTHLVGNTIYNPASDGIRISLESGGNTIFSPKVIGNTITGASAPGAVGIRLLHNGVAGAITDGVVNGNVIRDSSYGALFQGRVQNSVMMGNTARNNTNTDFDVSGSTIGNCVMLGNQADSTLSELLVQPLTMNAGATPLQFYRASGDLGLQYQVSGVGTWYQKLNSVTGGMDWEFGGSRKFTIGTDGSSDSTGNMRVRAASTGAAGSTCIGGTTATTVGGAGGAAALPAAPLGYIIAHVGNTQVKIPYYNN